MKHHLPFCAARLCEQSIFGDMTDMDILDVLADDGELILPLDQVDSAAPLY